jgi:hypothetical protein
VQRQNFSRGAVLVSVAAVRIMMGCRSLDAISDTHSLFHNPCLPSSEMAYAAVLSLRR